MNISIHLHDSNICITEGGDKLSEKIFDTLSCDARILEMVTDDVLLNVPISPSINIDVITADDPDPKFVNVEVLRGGTISGNYRRYNNNNARQISELISGIGIQGFLGHPDPSKYGFEFRDPQCIYVGSMLDTMPDGIVRCIAKCYLLKTSPLREWVPKSIAANNPMTVSINCSADVIDNGDYIDVVTINELDSIDWANPGTEGIGSSQAMSVVRELNSNNGGSKTMEVKEVLQNATVTEFKAYNPTGYTNMVGAVTLTELKDHNPNLVKAIEDACRITEMSINVGGQSKQVKLTEMQGIISGLEAQVASKENEVKTAKLTEFKTNKLNEMIPADIRENVSKRITGNTEEEVLASINTEIAYIREMNCLGPNDPIGRKQHEEPDDIKNAVANLFGVKIDKKK